MRATGLERHHERLAAGVLDRVGELEDPAVQPVEDLQADAGAALGPGVAPRLHPGPRRGQQRVDAVGSDPRVADTRGRCRTATARSRRCRRCPGVSSGKSPSSHASNAALPSAAAASPYTRGRGGLVEGGEVLPGGARGHGGVEPVAVPGEQVGGHGASQPQRATTVASVGARGHRVAAAARRRGGGAAAGRTPSAARTRRSPTAAAQRAGRGADPGRPVHAARGDQARPRPAAAPGRATRPTTRSSVGGRRGGIVVPVPNGWERTNLADGRAGPVDATRTTRPAATPCGSRSLDQPRHARADGRRRGRPSCPLDTPDLRPRDPRTSPRHAAGDLHHRRLPHGCQIIRWLSFDGDGVDLEISATGRLIDERGLEALVAKVATETAGSSRTSCARPAPPTRRPERRQKPGHVDLVQHAVGGGPVGAAHLDPDVAVRRRPAAPARRSRRGSRWRPGSAPGRRRRRVRVDCSTFSHSAWPGSCSGRSSAAGRRRRRPRPASASAPVLRVPAESAGSSLLLVGRRPLPVRDRRPSTATAPAPSATRRVV